MATQQLGDLVTHRRAEQTPLAGVGRLLEELVQSPVGRDLVAKALLGLSTRRAGVRGIVANWPVAGGNLRLERRSDLAEVVQPGPERHDRTCLRGVQTERGGDGSLGLLGQHGVPQLLEHRTGIEEMAHHRIRPGQPVLLAPQPNIQNTFPRGPRPVVLQHDHRDSTTD